jgi:two-component system, chemotaxis family, chemotaxis protein CheY
MPNFLVIDDDESMRELVGATLQRVGHTVTFAVSAKEALKLLETERPDIIVTDILMPNLDGIELVTALRKSHPELPIIAMSGSSRNSPLYLKTAQLLGARRTLMKPFTMDQFFEVVNALLRPA